MAGTLLIRDALRRVPGDAFAKLLSRRAVAGYALVVLAVGAAGLPYFIAQQARRCIREETINVFVGRVSQAQKVCVEYGDPFTEAERSPIVGVRFVPERPTRDAPFTIVVVGLEPGERIDVAVTPPGIGLNPASLVADRAGEARVDFRIPSGGAPDWVVVVTRRGGERMIVPIPLPPP